MQADPGCILAQESSDTLTLAMVQFNPKLITYHAHRQRITNVTDPFILTLRCVPKVYYHKEHSPRDAFAMPAALWMVQQHG
jgi:hypothetical protein